MYRVDKTASITLGPDVLCLWFSSPSHWGSMEPLWGPKRGSIEPFRGFDRPLLGRSPISGPEMVARILCAPGIVWLFLQENLHAHKIPCFRWGFGGLGGSANSIFMGAGIF